MVFTIITISKVVENSKKIWQILFASNFPASSEEEWLQYRWRSDDLFSVFFKWNMEMRATISSVFLGPLPFIFIVLTGALGCVQLTPIFLSTTLHLQRWKIYWYWYSLKFEALSICRVFCSSNSWENKLQFQGDSVRWAHIPHLPLSNNQEAEKFGT